MSNPAVRTNSILASLMAKKSNLDRVREVQLDTPTNPTLERRINNVVARVLDDAAESELEHAALDQVPGVEGDSASPADRNVDGPANAESQSPAPVSGYFRLPSLEDCGLTNPAITLDESQAEAVRSLANHQYGCLIGAAGTGKTTVQKYLLRELIYGENPAVNVRRLTGKQGLNIAMVAFTGMAVQVMRSNLPTWMHECCKTIHGLLEFEPEDTVNEKSGHKTRMFVPQRNNLRKLEHDIIVIDEASMLGLDLWMQLLAALRPGTRIYMTGDLNQLPPIIGQPIFAYALSSWHVCELTKVHRQKEPGANRIVEVAHEILNGKTNLTFDVLKNNPDWRVIFNELDKTPMKAAQQVINILNQLRQRRINPNDETSPFLYDPHKDRVMTAGNGYEMKTTADYVQQSPLNDRLSLLIEPPSEEHPRFIIDAGRVRRKFSVHNRVMATKNEAPSKQDRVTNGLAGTITLIERNPRYSGNVFMFGPESEVEVYIRSQLLAEAEGDNGNTFESLEDVANFELDVEAFDQDSTEDEDGAEDASGFASHSVTVLFDNGATRTFSTKTQVESIQLAYCSTVAKCQGSQFDTAIIVCHHSVKHQLSREWLYTAVTRGVKRVIILGTDLAVRHAISRQKIKGRTLADKIQRYQELLAGEAKTAYGTRLKINVPLFIEDYTTSQITFETKGSIHDANC